MNDEDHDSSDHVLAALARGLHPAPAAEPVAGVTWARVPGDHGYVAFVGASDVPQDQWTLPGTQITPARMEAERDRLVAEGLGSLAAVVWKAEPMVDGCAVAWGKTTTAALRHLIAGLRALWPDLQAAVASVADHQWAPGERRTSATGVTITAPLSAARYSDAVVRMLRSHVEMTIGLRGAGWIGALREVVAVDAPALAIDFEAHRHDAGSPEACVLPWAGSRGDGPALAAPSVRFKEVMGDAFDGRRR